MKITNKSNVPLALAVGLLSDNYDYVNNPNYMSATTTLRPTRQIILSSRVPKQEIDILDNFHTFLGSSAHSALEKAWLDKDAREGAMKLLGYKQHVLDLIEVNPEEPDPGKIQIYVEPKRRVKELNGWFIGGRPDLILDGVLHDYKTTSTFKWNSDDYDDYIIQGSIYRWLYPDLIHSDFISICFVFKDWKQGLVGKQEGYPDGPAKEIKLGLWSLEKTEQFLIDKIHEVSRYQDKAQGDIPECPEEELWMSPTVYKYYSNPQKTSGRSTKNFQDLNEANAWMASKGRGIVLTEVGKPRRCNYCAAYDICEQRKKYYGDDE